MAPLDFPIPPTPREVFEEGVPSLPTAGEIIPSPRDIVARREDVVRETKDFVVELTPKPKDVATAARELTQTTFADKVTTLAMFATPPAVLVAGGFIGVAVLIGLGVVGAGAGAGGAGSQFQLPELPKLPALPTVGT